MKKQDVKVVELVFVGVLAAMVYVVTLFRFPLLGSKVHFANAVCLLGGMLLGPWLGGIAAGLGSALYDAFTGYDFLNVMITFVSKFAMAWVCGAIMHKTGKGKLRIDRTVLSAVAGALTYVALYMLKSYITGAIAGNGWGVVSTKFPAAILNAAAAIVAAPIFYHAVLPALKGGGLLKLLPVDAQRR
ncbi:MAG: ECF transporter S component [Clostridia bacterium]|nr:ECF transporter S component [Clostridia bacterium]